MPDQLEIDALNSVNSLQCISKAIYIMRSNMDNNLYRFGAIGVQANNANTLIRRLGQCTSVEGGNVTNTWHYVAVATFDIHTQYQDVRAAEIALRAALIGRHGEFVEGREGNQDRFTTNKHKAVLKIFTKVVNNLNA